MANVETIDVKGTAVPVGELKGIDLKGLMIDVASGVSNTEVFIGVITDFIKSNNKILKIPKATFKKEHSKFYMFSLQPSPLYGFVVGFEPWEPENNTVRFYYKDTSGIGTLEITEDNYVFDTTSVSYKFYADSGYPVCFVAI